MKGKLNATDLPTSAVFAASPRPSIYRPGPGPRLPACRLLGWQTVNHGMGATKSQTRRLELLQSNSLNTLHQTGMWLVQLVKLVLLEDGLNLGDVFFFLFPPSIHKGMCETYWSQLCAGQALLHPGAPGVTELLLNHTMWSTMLTAYWIALQPLVNI